MDCNVFKSDGCTFEPHQTAQILSHLLTELPHSKTLLLKTESHNFVDAKIIITMMAEEGG